MDKNNRTGTDAVKAAAAGVDAVEDALTSAKNQGGVLLKTLKDIAGPLEIASGVALGFALKLTFGIGKSETLRRGLEKIARIQYYTPQFAKMLGGLDVAKRRLAEIERSKAAKVFGFDEAVEGNKRLETLSRGVLSTKQGMALVGDVSAVTGAKFSDMSDILGNLYADIANDRSIDGAVDQLVSMGAVSGAAGDKLKLLQASGATTTAMWAAMHAELSKTQGGLDAASRTIDGLERQLTEAHAANDKAFAVPFDEGKLAGIEAAVKLTEALKPAFEQAGRVLSVFYNILASVSKGFADWITAFPIVGNLLKGLVTGFLALIGILGLFSLVTTVQVVASLARMAAGMLATAAAGSILARTMGGLRTAMNFALGPVGWLITAVTVLAGLFGALGSDTGELGAMQAQLKNKVEDTTKALREQIAAVQTQSEKADAIAKANRNMVDAEKSLAAAKDKRSKAWFKQGPQKEVQDARVALLAAQEQAQEAWNKSVDPNVSATFGEDYQAVAEESRKRMADLQERLNATKEAKSRDNIAAQMQAEAGRDLKGEADRRFQRRQIMGESQVAAMREVGARTGDRGMLDAADAKENAGFRDKRRKELLAQGLKGNALNRVLESDTLMNRIDMQQRRGGSPSQSSLASIGGSGGFAGVVNDVPKQTLETLKRLMAEVQEINGKTGKEDMDRKFQNT